MERGENLLNSYQKNMGEMLQPKSPEEYLGEDAKKEALDWLEENMSSEELLALKKMVEERRGVKETSH